MGEPVTVIEKPSRTPGTVRFEINRSITGTGHETYLSAADAEGVAPSDELARMLFAHGGVASVHVYANIITVHLADGGTSAGLKELIEGLYIYYKEGVEVAKPV